MEENKIKTEPEAASEQLTDEDVSGVSGGGSIEEVCDEGIKKYKVYDVYGKYVGTFEDHDNALIAMVESDFKAILG